MARRTIQMVGVVLAAAVLGASAYNRPEASKDFKDLDMDESGHVDRAEVDAHLDRQFDAEAQVWMEFYDTNKDGRVHKDEYFGLPKSNQRYWDSVDINSDDYTGPDEMKINRDRSHPNRVDTYLKYYDDNGDGQVHKHEFDAKHNDL